MSQKKNLVERLETLEFQMNRVTAIQGLAMNLKKTLEAVIEMQTAFIDEMGGNELLAKVVTRLEDKRSAKRREEAERSKAILDELIKSEQVEAVDVIDATSIITGIENTPDGKIQNEELQMNIQSFTKDIQNELIGKAVGYAVVREEKEVFKVTGIYKMKKTEPKALTETPVEPPQEAAPVASEPTEPIATSEAAE